MFFFFKKKKSISATHKVEAVMEQRRFNDLTLIQIRVLARILLT